MEQVMASADLIDYAYPMMMAERNLRDAYNALIEGDLETGEKHLLDVLVETRMAMNAVKHMKEAQR